MADAEDLKALHEGNRDLVRRDFRDAKLSGLDLSGRDFSHSHLEQANMSHCNLAGSVFTQAMTRAMDMGGANLTGAQAAQTVIFGVNLRNADLREANFTRSHFTGSDLTGADLTGADFRNAVFNDGNRFEGCRVSETTKFDAASILRPLSRQEAFRYYRVDRGVLIRKTADELSANEPRSEPMVPDVRQEIVRCVDDVLSSLASLTPSSSESLAPGIGHNNPPESPFDQAEFGDVVDALKGVKVELAADEPDAKKLDADTSRVSDRTKQILRWAGRKLDLAADELAKSLGNTNRLVTVWLACSTKMSDLVHLLHSFIGSLTH